MLKSGAALKGEARRENQNPTANRVRKGLFPFWLPGCSLRLELRHLALAQ